MTELQKALRIITSLEQLGLDFTADVTVHRPEIFSALDFIELYGITEQRWVPSGAGDFRTVEVGRHIKIYLDGHKEEVEAGGVENPALRSPLGAIGLAYAFFGPEQIGSVEGSITIIVHRASAEQGVQVMQLFDATVEPYVAEDGTKWIKYGPVSIFFNKEAPCSA